MIPERDHRHVSRIAGTMWHSLPETEREQFRLLSIQRKNEHMTTYPGYVYSPSYKRKAGRPRAKRDLAAERRQCKRLADMLYSGCKQEELEQEVRKAKEDEKAASPGPVRVARSHRGHRTRAPYTVSRRRTAHDNSCDTTTRQLAAMKIESHRSPAPSPVSPVVKPEPQATPQFACPPLPEDTFSYVATDDIPPLNLSGNQVRFQFCSHLYRLC